VIKNSVIFTNTRSTKVTHLYLLVNLSKCINLNVLNNDKLLVNKIVSILEGKQHYSESFKLEIEDNVSTFKIILNVKAGVSIIIFTCPLENRILNNSKEVLLNMIEFYKNKLIMIKKTDETIEELNRENISRIQKLNSLSTNIFNEENELLDKMCEVLNGKKQEIRKLGKAKGVYFEEDNKDNVFLKPSQSSGNVNESLNLSQQEDANNSIALSLIDLI
jgi:hypothetical protein